MQTNTIYKICTEEEWAKARQTGMYKGSQADLSDGFIHFSSANQVVETAAKHFAGQEDLILLEIDEEVLGDKLKWEPSRGGALFPHLYGTLKADDVCSSNKLPLDENGNHEFPV